MDVTIVSRDGLIGMVRNEQAALNTLVEEVSDADWTGRMRNDGWTIHDVVGHIADGLFGIDSLVHGLLPAGPMDLDMDKINADRYEVNRGLSRNEIESKLDTGFKTILATINEMPDLNAAGPFGPDRTMGDWLSIAVYHTATHRGEIEQALKA